MAGRKLVYIANARLPTEKAHGYQIGKMCEALAMNGMEVVLVHPQRHQVEPTLRQSSVFEYYGIQPTFEVRTLANWDVVRCSIRIPARWFTPIFFAHAMSWGLYAAICAYREGADLSYTRESQVAFWLAQLGLPTVYEVHAVPRRGQRWLLQRMAGSSALQLVVALTSFIKERLVHLGFPAHKVMVCPDGVDLAMFENLPSKVDCRRRLGLPPDRLIIGYLGRFQTLEMEKGIPELVEAMAHVPPLRGLEPLLLCVGGPMHTAPAYLDLARQLGVPQKRLQFVDRVPNRQVPYWIRAFDVAVAPFPEAEHYAYFMSPLKIFEYLAAGAPIVATDLPALREVLKHGENAWLVNPRNAKALAEGIRHLLENESLRCRLSQRALGSARAYTWSDRAAQILNRVA